jgi:hypothetical protein
MRRPQPAAFRTRSLKLWQRSSPEDDSITSFSVMSGMAQTIPLQLFRSLPATIPNAMDEGASGVEVAPFLSTTWSKRDSYLTQRTMTFSEKAEGCAAPLFFIRPSEIGAGSFPSPAPLSRQNNM